MQHVACHWQTGDLAALDAFEALFKEAKFYKGLEMSFTNTKEGSLALRIGNKEVSPRTLDVCLSPTHAPSFGVDDQH